jgi:hypothetical protein
VILRRRDDTFERVISEHLGGALFATEHPMDKWFERELNDAQKEKPHLVSSEDRRALLPQAIHDDGRKSETNDQENRTREIPRDGSGTTQSIAERVMKPEEWRPWHDLSPELTGDARIAAEKQALANWLDRPFPSEIIAEHAPTDEEVARAVAHIISYRRDKMLREICEHIRSAPDREAVALRVANKLNSVTIVFEERAK